jgi:hypothetical protein
MPSGSVRPHELEWESVFLRQAEQAEGRSPLYAGLSRKLATEPAVGRIIESPPRWDAALRLFSALHFLVLRGDVAWDQIDVALTEYQPELRRLVAEQSIQTNEVQRCWLLLPCFLEAVRRTGASTVDLVELGASAGLNLLWDRYAYRYAQGDWGTRSAPLTLTGEEKAEVPADLLGVRPTVGFRVGVDVAPIDATTDEGALMLKSFVWADQAWRLELLDRAIAVCRNERSQVEPGSIPDVLPRLLEQRRDDALTIVWQTAVFGYLSLDERQAVRVAMHESGRRRGNLAFVEATKPDDGSDTYWGLFVQTWPDGERRQVGLADFHGAWIDWQRP